MSDTLETKDMEEGPMGKSDPNKPIEYRMVLIGRTGEGKSSAGNTILDQPEAFDSKPGDGSVTKTCKSVKKTVAGRNVLLVDTPGLFDTTRDQEDIKEEILGFVALSSPGPHVFLLVMKIGRTTPEVKETYKRISDILGNKGQPYTIILFTNGDDLEFHKQSIEEYINDATDDLKEILAEAGHRYVVFNNRLQGDRREEQVIALFEKVDALVTENKGGVFTSDFYDEAEEALLQKEIEERDALLKEKEEEEKKLKERLKQKQKAIEDFDIERKQMAWEEGPMGKSDPNKPIEYTLVLIGRTGDGKSSAGNTILDQPEAFDSKPGDGSVTKTCKSVKKTVAGRNVLLVDTPGVLDNARDQEDIKEEILGSVALSSPGPHVFLFVTKIGRATKEVKETYKRISDILGNKGQPYTIILFTNGDDLEFQGQSIEEYINDATDDLKEILAEAGHRYVVFNNRLQGDRREEQVIALFEKVDALVTENKGDVFTSDFYDEAEDALLNKEIEERDALLKKKEEEEKKLKERLKQKQKAIEDLERKQRERVKQQLEHRENQMGQMQREYESKITQIREAHDAQYKTLEDRYKTDLVNVRDATRKEINANPKKVSESWFKGKLKRFLNF